MTSYHAKTQPSYLVAFRFALRELRGGLRGFGIFLACIVLGVAAIAAVGSVARGMSESIAREGQTLLGGDIDAELVHRRVGQVLVYLLPALAVIAGVYAIVWRRRHRGGPPQEPRA